MVGTFLPINLYKAKKLKKHVLFTHPENVSIMWNFLMRSLNLKRLELYQNLDLSQSKSLAWKHSTELLITWLRE
jgi:hypothetical protein